MFKKELKEMERKKKSLKYLKLKERKEKISSTKIKLNRFE